MAVRVLHMTILNVSKTSYPKKELNFIIMTSWVVATLIFRLTPRFGIYPVLLKRWNK